MHQATGSRAVILNNKPLRQLSPEKAGDLQSGDDFLKSDKSDPLYVSINILSLSLICIYDAMRSAGSLCDVIM